jgi:hypothetical protein
VNRASHSTLRAIVPWLLGVLWLCFVCWRIWFYARSTLQLPVYDAFSYYGKAHAIWDDIAHGLRLNPLNIEPSIRPPGTLLMSYPFGFQLDFHGFYFRSVFFPIFLIFVSVLLVLKKPGQVLRDGVSNVALAAFLSTPSLLLHFDFANDQPLIVSYWGLVDGFLMGLAALAAACAIRSLRDKSLAYAVAGIVLGTVMIFVKPAGALLALLGDCAILSGWLLYAIAALRTARQRAPVVVQTSALIFFGLAMSVGAILIARHSRYLGPDNMAVGIASLQVLRTEFPIQLSELFPLMQSGLGPIILVWLLGSLAILLPSLIRRKRQHGTPFALATFEVSVAALVLLVGAWFWIYGSGGFTQIRYFLPFVFMAWMWALNPIDDALAESGAPVRWMSAVLIAAGIFNVALLLSVPQPAKAWQRLSGVDLTAGSYPPGLDQARLVVAATSATTSLVQVYSLNQSVNDAMFESVFDAQLFDRAVPKFVVRRPIDWQRPSTFHIEEIAASDYLLFNPTYCPAAAQAEATDEVTTFNDEEFLFCRWASRLDAADGIERISSEPESVLLKVVNQDELRHSLQALVLSHHWRPVFTYENPPLWWSEADINAALTAQMALAKSIRFGQEFELGAASIERNRDDKITFNIWLRAASQPMREDWKLIIHVLDSKGEVIANHDTPAGIWAVAPADKPFRYIRVSFVVQKEAREIAFGIYHDHTLLIADGGKRDWGGGRLILALPSVPGP